MRGTDATGCLTGEGGATIFFAADYDTAECAGLHAARRSTRLEALEPLAQGLRTHLGAYREWVAGGLALRHDHGSPVPCPQVIGPRGRAGAAQPGTAPRASGGGTAAGAGGAPPLVGRQAVARARAAAGAELGRAAARGPGPHSAIVAVEQGDPETVALLAAVVVPAVAG